MDMGGECVYFLKTAEDCLRHCAVNSNRISDGERM